MLPVEGKLRGHIKCLVMSEVHVATITLRNAGSFALMTIARSGAARPALPKPHPEAASREGNCA